jgi:hypothetical protein
MRRLLIILATTVIPAGAQVPLVHLSNATHPASSDFQIGDRYKVLIAGPAGQPISVRTTVQGRTDWGPVIGTTGTDGQWSTTGQFSKSDFGDRNEIWTVGGRVANPPINFSVQAPCLKGGPAFAQTSGPNMRLTCETEEGTQGFGTPSLIDPFRTPDGRVIVPGPLSDRTAAEYQAEIMQYRLTGSETNPRSAQLGNAAGAMIMKLIGPNALTDLETRNALSIVRAAFERPDRIPQAEKDVSATLLLLRKLADGTADASLKQQISETIAFVQVQ